MLFGNDRVDKQMVPWGRTVQVGATVHVRVQVPVQSMISYLLTSGRAARGHSRHWIKNRPGETVQ